jgi:hypothetical protein
MCMFEYYTIAFFYNTNLNTVKPAYNGHAMEPEHMPFISICSLYTYYDYTYYSLIVKMRLSFIDSDLLHSGVTNTIDRHDIIEILLKVELNTIPLTLQGRVDCSWF